ncbi:MAG TPA: hypothetical protein VFL83_19560 [Anaeromyxobacter sp.]|nr:hypothetical protein [Anaeromyxobacter sp.]
MSWLFRRGGTKPREAAARLDAFLARRGLDRSRLTPRRALDAMIELYRTERFDRCDLANDGDMLLFQWGAYEWEGPDRFSLDVTRQLMWSDPEGDDQVWQLSIRFGFPLTDAMRAAGSSNRWCRAPSELDGFRAFVESTPAYAAVADDARSAPEIRFESAE